jgi:hypothetical protein
MCGFPSERITLYNSGTYHTSNLELTLCQLGNIKKETMCEMRQWWLEQNQPIIMTIVTVPLCQGTVRTSRRRSHYLTLSVRFKTWPFPTEWEAAEGVE